MKAWPMLCTFALCSALTVFSTGCDDDAADDATAGAPESGGEVSDNGDPNDTADAEEEMDTGPIPREQFEQLKEQWALQVTGAEESAATLMKVNEEHKDAQLAQMLEQINARIAGIRETLNNVTPENGRQALTVDIPMAVTEVGEMRAKAMERMQEVITSKVPGG